MENKKTLSSIIIALVAILIIAVIVSLINFNNYTPSKNLIVDETYEVKDIIIKSNASNIYIKETEEQIIKVKIYGDENKTIIEDFDKLNIKSNVKTCNFICFNTKTAKIEIYLPKDYDNNIVIDSDYGNVEIGNFENMNIDIDADAGNINIGEVSSASLDVDAGNVDITKINKYLDIDIDAGNLKIKELNLLEDSNVDIDAGNIEINKTNEIHIVSKIDVGETKIKNNYESDVTLSIKVDIGNININN